MNACLPRALLVFAFCAATVLGIRGAAADDPVVQLPPVIVSETTAARPWRYARADGIEVLSRCRDGDTVRIIRRNAELAELVALVVPPEFQFKPRLPQMLVLADASEAPAFARRVVGSAGATFLPNLELTDLDAISVFELVDSARLARGEIGFSDAHIALLLDLRTPPLPRWIRVGYARLFWMARFGDRSVMFRPFVPLSLAARRDLALDPNAPREVMPLLDFFRHDADPRVADGAVWAAQAELLLRWCLATPERRDGLRRFVASYHGENWEECVRTCFGLGASDLRDRLSDGLADAMNGALELTLTSPSRAPGVELRDARPAEVARLKGEWDRLAALYVRRVHPELAVSYAELAGRTVHAPLPAGEEDAGVCAARGLYELDLGSRALARPWLEAAAAKPGARPRVHVELARLRLDDAIATVGPGGIISPAQAEIVLGELARARGQEPPLASADALTAEVWFRAGMRFDPARREELVAALARHPKDPPLLYWAAAWCAQGGSRDMAVLLARQGMAVVVDADDRKASFEKLLATLQAPPAKR